MVVRAESDDAGVADGGGGDRDGVRLLCAMDWWSEIEIGRAHV